MLLISHTYGEARLVAPVGLPSPQTLCREPNGLSLGRGAGYRGDGTVAVWVPRLSQIKHTRLKFWKYIV